MHDLPGRPGGFGPLGWPFFHGGAYAKCRITCRTAALPPPWPLTWVQRVETGNANGVGVRVSPGAPISMANGQTNIKH